MVDEGLRMNHLAPALGRRVSGDSEIADHRELVGAMRDQDMERSHAIMERHSEEFLRQQLAGLTEI